jgi:hypothetical protein
MPCGRRANRANSLLAYGSLIVATAWTDVRAAAVQGTHPGTFEAALVRCADVTQPARLPRCGTDPLLDGSIEITDEGDVEITVVRALPNVTYKVVYRSPSGIEERAIGSLRTDGSGNGALNAEDVFRRDQIGAGNLVLTRGGSDQFVSGFKVRR